MLTANEIIEIQRALDAIERSLAAQIRGAINQKFGHELPELECDFDRDNSAPAAPSLFDDNNIGFIRREVNELFAVEAAREAITQGTYGSCAMCHQPIEFQRLQARPTTVCCLPCQKQLNRPIQYRQELRP